MTPEERAEWVLRVFGSEDAYRRSLPSRVWEKTDKGWASRER